MAEQGILRSVWNSQFGLMLLTIVATGIGVVFAILRGHSVAAIFFAIITIGVLGAAGRSLYVTMKHAELS